MLPLFREILDLIDLPTSCKAAIRAEINSGNEDIPKAVKKLLPLFESVRINWPYESAEFDARFVTPKARLNRLYSQVLMEKYQTDRYSSIIENAGNRPYWMLVPLNEDTAPKDCQKTRLGRPIHYQDAFWTTSPVFCQCLDCGCRIRALTERQYNNATTNKN